MAIKINKTTIITDLYQQPNKKILYYLNYHSTGKKALFIFDRGLGDLIEFLPIFTTIEKEFPKWDLYLGYNSSLAFSDIFHKKMYSINQFNKSIPQEYLSSPVQSDDIEQKYDLYELSKEFDYIFNIKFMDPRFLDNISGYKVDICKTYEFGYNVNKKLLEYNKDFNYLIDDNIKKRICIHCGGHTDKNSKNPSYIVFKQIWNEIEELGYEPFDLHRNNISKVPGTTIPLPDFINPNNSIRDLSNVNMEEFIKYNINCDYFIGILSGPLHLSTLLFKDNPNKIIALEKDLKISTYVSRFNINTINVNNYIPNTIKNLIIELDNRTN